MSQFSDLAQYLTTKLNAIITALNGKVDKVTGKGLSTEDYTTSDKNKLSGIESGAQVNVGDTFDETGNYVDLRAQATTKADVGLGNVDNTSDANKPVSTAQQTALDDKVDKVSGKGLSTNDYTNSAKSKLTGIESGAQVNNNDFDQIRFLDNTGTPIQNVSAAQPSDRIDLKLLGQLTGNWDSTNSVFELDVDPQSVATGSTAGLVIVGRGLNVDGSGNVSVDTSVIAPKSYVDQEINGLLNSAPGTLDTLNELAAALGDDPNFATTITNQISTVSGEVTTLENDIGTSAEFETYMDANLSTIS